MLIEELHLTRIDALGDLLADLMRTPTLDHVETRPAVLGLRARRRADEEGVLQLALERVLLDVVRQRRGNLPTRWSAPLPHPV